MPIEIKELHIKVNVNSTSDTPPAVGFSTGTNPGAESENTDQKTADLLEQMLQILENKKER